MNPSESYSKAWVLDNNQPHSHPAELPAPPFTHTPVPPSPAQQKSPLSALRLQSGCGPFATSKPANMYWDCIIITHLCLRTNCPICNTFFALPHLPEWQTVQIFYENNTQQMQGKRCHCLYSGPQEMTSVKHLGIIAFLSCILCLHL